MRKFFFFSFFFCFLSVFLITSHAHAHKVIASAWIDGADIEGEVGLSNGEMAQNGTVVEVYSEQDEKIGETVITDDGLFRFTPTKAIAHKFVANLGAGHVAYVVVSVDELPDGLSQKPQGVTTTSVSEKETDNTAAPVLANGDIARIVAKAVRNEVQPLRKEIASYKEKNDFQTILGGIGYILGLTGVICYIAARRKEKQNT